MANTLLLQGQQLILDFGDARLLDDVNFNVHAKDRIAIIGRNGEGKSTLMSLMQQKIKPDSGQCRLQTGLITASLAQNIPEQLSGTVGEWVRDAQNTEQQWAKPHLAEQIIMALKLDADADMAALSGGTLRRALLACALITEPDILFLDEPTNHLDIDSIAWLQNYLQNYQRTLVFVTHDRIFMQALATRIFELDRGILTCWDGNYHRFLTHKQQTLEAESTANALFDKKLAQEERWIRQGIKARRTRNEGRVRALKKLREERAQRRDTVGVMSLHTQTCDNTSAKQVFECTNVCISQNNNMIIKDFSCLIRRGDKIGIIGPNGCGKTTLINTLLGHITPTAGQIKRAEPLSVAYFDQHRAQLDPDATALDAVAEGRTSVDVNGKSKHIISYLQDFMFTPDKARKKVRVLSGGERNRLMLAKILLIPCQVLVMDEPTNDLDIESLELLESFLSDFQGTLLLVSHDRALINNVVTSTLVFEGDGHIKNYIGGFDDMIRQKKASLPTEPDQPSTSSKPSKTKAKPKTSQKMIDKLTKQIEKTEVAIATWHEKMAEPDYYQQEAETLANNQATLEKLEKKRDQLYQEWDDTESS